MMGLPAAWFLTTGLCKALYTWLF